MPIVADQAHVRRRWRRRVRPAVGGGASAGDAQGDARHPLSTTSSRHEGRNECPTRRTRHLDQMLEQPVHRLARDPVAQPDRSGRTFQRTQREVQTVQTRRDYAAGRHSGCYASRPLLACDTDHAAPIRSRCTTHPRARERSAGGSPPAGLCCGKCPLPVPGPPTHVGVMRTDQARSHGGVYL